MATVIESDLGTKDMAIRACQRIREMRDDKLDHMMAMFWRKVYYRAIQECPKETGALASSHRVKRADEEASGPNTVALRGGMSGATGTSADDVVKQWYITAGGEGVVNPRHGKEVDYAEAVHNGYRRGKKWISGNPWLARAWNKSVTDFDQFVEDYINWIKEEWGDETPAMPSGNFWMNVPVGLRLYK